MHWTEIAERQSGAVIIFDLHGVMTLSGEEEPRLLRQIRRAVQDGHRHVLLNLTTCPTSTALASARSSAPTRVSSREGGSLKLFGLSARIEELLDTTNIGTVIASFPDEAAALRSFDEDV